MRIKSHFPMLLKVSLFLFLVSLFDDHDDYDDQLSVKSYFPMLIKAINDGYDAINDGYDVRGVYFWTLMDNIEWHEGFHVKFGLCEWDPGLKSRPGSRDLKGMKLRPGSRALKEVYDSWPNDLAALKSHAEKTDAGATWVENPVAKGRQSVESTADAGDILVDV
eukprot:gene3474-13535_t